MHQRSRLEYLNTWMNVFYLTYFISIIPGDLRYFRTQLHETGRKSKGPICYHTPLALRTL